PAQRRARRGRGERHRNHRHPRRVARMSVVELRARGNATGSYVRPQGSDSYPPAVGVSVGWVLAQPVQDLLDQGRALKWRNLGTIGNLAHLQKHGDHTAHSAGKVRGVVYAKDTELPG